MKDAKERAFPTWRGESNLSWLRNSFPFPDYAATVLFVVLGGSLRLVWFACQQQTTQEAKSKKLQRTWWRLFWLMRRQLGWGQRHNDDAQRHIQQPADLNGHTPHTSCIPLSMCIKDSLWSHSNETDLHLRLMTKSLLPPCDDLPFPEEGSMAVFQCCGGLLCSDVSQEDLEAVDL